MEKPYSAFSSTQRICLSFISSNGNHQSPAIRSHTHPQPHDHTQTMAEVTTNQTECVATQTPPVLKGPSEKEKKYDRQLRLWAANGQAALEKANILLFNTGSGTVGVETLKNLVLPGMKDSPPLPHVRMTK